MGGELPYKQEVKSSMYQTQKEQVNMGCDSEEMCLTCEARGMQKFSLTTLGLGCSTQNF